MIIDTMVHGSRYKVGVHDRVFRWVNGGWVSSSKTHHDLMEAIRRSKDDDTNKI